MPAVMDVVKEVLHVRVVADDTKLAPAPKERVSIPKSYQASATPQAIIPHSPNRVRAEVYVQGVVGTNASVFLCSSSGDCNGVIAGEINTAAAQVQPGFRMVILGTSELWLVCPGVTPPIVTVIDTVER